VATPIITLTTDYGAHDHYVAVLKGVILALASDVRVVDVTHDIPPHDVESGAFVLSQIWSWFPAGTIHVAVVDPGVGSQRRVLVGRYGGSLLVVPDNGLLTFVDREHPVEALHVAEDRRFFLSRVSSTFHGRDILAPVAAHLALGVRPERFGRPADRVELLDIPFRAVRSGERLAGRVLHVDRFGTLVTNVHASQLGETPGRAGAWHVRVGGVDLGALRATFADVPKGEPAVLIGSGGFVEIAVNQGRAVDRFGRNPPVDVLPAMV